jgi:hypothetical protein
MKRLKICSLFACWLSAFGLVWPANAEPQAPAPELKQVYDLLREHAAGVSEADLNRKAVQALLNSLGSKAALVAGKADSMGQGPLLKRTNLFDGGMVYLKVGRIGEGLAPAVASAYKGFATSNRLNGVVLDLRYAGGKDYAAAAAVADLFQAKAKPLLDWGAGLVSSKEKPDAITVPLAVLVNHETAAGAEALAAVLRQTGTGLIFGRRTAGQAAVGTQYPLSNGQQLWIATKPVVLGDGTSISLEGVQPDIEVQVESLSERAFYDDPFKVVESTNTIASVSGSSTNSSASGTRASRRVRFGEAELVRGHREGFDPDAEGATGNETDIPAVLDPALARALDVLKGLAVVRNARP